MNAGTCPDTCLPLYKALANQFREQIVRGELTPGQWIGTELELARRQQVARMTIRRAVEILVREGLVVRQPGKGLYVRERHTTTRTIHFISGNLVWEPSVQIYRGAQALAGRHGIEIQIYDAHGDVQRDLAILQNLPAATADGAIVMSLHSPAFTTALFELKAAGVPFVVFDQHLADTEITSVTADNYHGGYQVGQALVALGHQRIGFVGDLATTTVRDRLAGLRDAIADAGLPFDRSLAIDLMTEPLADWSAAIDRATEALMTRPDRPTALFFSCDGVARPAYRTLARLGLRIPHDVSVVGFDDDPLSEWLTPALSTVRQPFFQMGQVAMELLEEQMHDLKRPAEHPVLPVTYIARESTAAPR
jgi:LacI family transcriptional regulator